jgi:hypothetical protein
MRLFMNFRVNRPLTDGGPSLGELFTHEGVERLPGNEVTDLLQENDAPYYGGGEKLNFGAVIERGKCLKRAL